MLTMLSAMGLASLPEALWVLPLALGGGLLFSALGLVTTALVPKIDAFNLPIFLLVMPMFLFGGTFFPLDGLPAWAMGIAMTLPLTHLGILVRGACLGSLPPSWIGSVAYLGLLSVPAFWLGLVLMRRRLVK
jgi:lipooligosaccharide transport system permease protein